MKRWKTEKIKISSTAASIEKQLEEPPRIFVVCIPHSHVRNSQNLRIQIRRIEFRIPMTIS